MIFWIFAKSEKLTKFRLRNFCQNPKISRKLLFRIFSRKCLHFKHFRINLNENSHFQKRFQEIFSKIGDFRKRYIVQTLSCPGCPVQVTHWPTCPVRPISAVLSQLSGPRCPILYICPVLAVLLFQVPVPSSLPKPHWPLLS
jgi:hypothetical protein